MKKNRIISVILLITVFLAVFSVVGIAAAEDSSGAIDPSSENTASVTDTPEPDTDTDNSGAVADEGDAESGDTDADGEVENVFETLFIKVKNHAGEICSALALVASLVLAYCYKCGLMPIIQNALGAISNVLSGIEKGADESSRASAEAISAFKARLEHAEELIERLAENMDMLTRDLQARTLEAKSSEDTRVILSAQVDMLYDIFMTSALPQYQKDTVGERIAAMRGALLKNDDEQTC